MKVEISGLAKIVWIRRQMAYEKSHMQNEQKAIVSNFSIFLLISFS